MCLEMSGRCVLTFMVPIQEVHRTTQLAHRQRLIITVVLAAVRTTSAFTLSFGALLVNGAAQIARATTAASASSQDRARIQFSEAAFVFHRSSEAKWEPRNRPFNLIALTASLLGWLPRTADW